MKVNLSGLMRNCRDALRRSRDRNGAMHAYCLEELQEHIEGLVAGKYTLDEFADHYCIKRPGTVDAVAPPDVSIKTTSAPGSEFSGL